MQKNLASRAAVTFTGKTMCNPYTDTVENGIKTRTFSATVDSEELVWHQDRAHREVTVIEGQGWYFQFDNGIPFELKPGQELTIPKMEFHRLYRAGTTNLVINIKESAVPSFTSFQEKLTSKYGQGLSKSTQKKREAQFKRQAAMSDSDPDAYKLAPGDHRAKTMPSKYTKAYHNKYGEGFDYGTTDLTNLYKKDTPGQLDEKTIEGLKKKSEDSGISYGILKKVFDRGMAAWKSGHRPGAGPHQWAFARVNSFIVGGKTRTTADADLWALHRSKKESLEEETWEAGFKRRVVKTTNPNHIEKGFTWRIKGKDDPDRTIKLYKTKPDFEEFKRQMKRIAGHEFGG